MNADEEWWITTDWLANGGRKKLGPFESQALALRVRGFVEKAEGRDGAYFVDHSVIAFHVPSGETE